MRSMMRLVEKCFCRDLIFGPSQSWTFLSYCISVMICITTRVLIPSVILHTWKYFLQCVPFQSRSNWPKIGLHTIRRGRDLHKFASKCLCGRFFPRFWWNLNGLLQQSNLSKWFVYNRVTFCKLWHHAASAAAAYVKSKNGLDALLPQQIWNTFCKL